MEQQGLHSVDIICSNAVRQSMLAGIDQLADTVKGTIGPKDGT